MAYPRKVTAPIARSTAYDFNCELAHCHRRSRDTRTLQRTATVGDAGPDECVSIMPHELLFKFTDDTADSSRRMRAMSSLNGCRLPGTVAEDLNTQIQGYGIAGFNVTDFQHRELDPVRQATNGELRRENNILNSCIQYVGVAVTGCAGGAQGALQRQGFSATRGGLVTVVHTGKKAIPAGAKVAMEFDISDLAEDRPRGASTHDGIPMQKIVPHLVKVEDDRDIALGVLAGAGNAAAAVPVNLPFVMNFGAPAGRPI